MSIYNRISAIQARMQEIQSKFGATQTDFTSCSGMQGMTQASLGQSPANLSGISFEQLLASKMNNMPTSSKTASDVKNYNLSDKASDYNKIIQEASQKYGVNVNFIKSIIQQESGFNPNAKSWVGAMGLMQLMPGTARELGVKNAYDPRENIMGGVKYIKQQLDRFGGDKKKALAAYNAGPGAVNKYGGIPPYRETQNYVMNIMEMFNSMKKK